jgi:hypothetical protein
MESLEQRVDLVQQDTKLLPALPPSTQKAITDGREAITDAVVDGIESSVNPIVAADSGVSREFLIKRVAHLTFYLG